jgi:ketosteroid isomerase-like protein
LRRGILAVVVSPNVELVRSLYANWERGDYSSGGEWADPEIEWVIADGPDPGTWRGVAGMAEGFRASFGVWTDVHAEVEEYRELDGERVLVLEWRRARGKASGLDLSRMRSEGAVVFHLRDGKVARLVFYWERARASTDLGLTPEGGLGGV